MALHIRRWGLERNLGIQKTYSMQNLVDGIPLSLRGPPSPDVKRGCLTQVSQENVSFPEDKVLDTPDRGIQHREGVSRPPL